MEGEQLILERLIERAPRSPTGIAPVILGAGRCGFFGRYLREVGAAFYLLLNGIGGTLIGDDDLPVVDGFRNRWDFCREFVWSFFLRAAAFAMSRYWLSEMFVRFSSS